MNQQGLLEALGINAVAFILLRQGFTTQYEDHGETPVGFTVRFIHRRQSGFTDVW
jgi:hypothetical protein